MFVQPAELNASMLLTHLRIVVLRRIQIYTQSSFLRIDARSRAKKWKLPSGILLKYTDQTSTSLTLHALCNQATHLRLKHSAAQKTSGAENAVGGGATQSVRRLCPKTSSDGPIALGTFQNRPENVSRDNTRRRASDSGHHISISSIT